MDLANLLTYLRIFSSIDLRTLLTTYVLPTYLPNYLFVCRFAYPALHFAECLCKLIPPLCHKNLVRVTLGYFFHFFLVAGI